MGETVYSVGEALRRREAMRAEIAARDLARGRPLTDAEKLENIRRWLDDDSEPEDPNNG